MAELGKELAATQKKESVIIAKIKRVAEYLETTFTTWIDTILVGIHNIIATIAETIRQAVESPERFLFFALGAVLVLDVALAGRLSILRELLSLFIGIIEGIDAHRSSAVILAVGVVVALMLWKEIKKEKGVK